MGPVIAPDDEGFEDDEEEVAVGVVVDEGLLESMAMSSKDVERISSRRTLASLTTDLESRRMCSPKRDLRLDEDEDEDEDEREGVDEVS